MGPSLYTPACNELRDMQIQVNVFDIYLTSYDHQPISTVYKLTQREMSLRDLKFRSSSSKIK